MGLKGIKFSISAVQSGQKSSVLNATPQLLVKSTDGQFTITAPVSKALAIPAGDNVMFLSNVDAIEREIENKNPDVLAIAEENGWDLNTVEGKDAFIAAATVWYIAKGVPMYKKSGEPIYGTIRVAKEDKLAKIAADGLAMIQEMSEEDKAAYAAAKGLEGADDETLAAALTVDDIPSPTYHAASGSKTSATAQATGTGLQLNFTDTAIWNNLKSDLADKNSVVRVYNVKLDEAEIVEFNNGKEIVKVAAYPIEFAEDKAPAKRGEKYSDATEGGEAAE